MSGLSIARGCAAGERGREKTIELKGGRPVHETDAREGA